MQLAELDRKKTYTYADYYSWDFDKRVELIKGKVFDLPTPWTIHQLVSGIIAGELYNYIDGKSIEVFTSPFDIRLSTISLNDQDIYTVVQPDICVICDPNKIDERGGIGAPDIMVEILSPGNNRKELQNKYEVYEEAGVLEYWIIHPQEKTFFKYTLIDNCFQPSRLLTIGDEVTTPILPGFILSLDELFANV
jgi:Uma2 family endonuclease